jgi:hypothetical protein
MEKHSSTILDPEFLFEMNRRYRELQDQVKKDINL